MREQRSPRSSIGKDQQRVEVTRWLWTLRGQASGIKRSKQHQKVKGLKKGRTMRATLSTTSRNFTPLVACSSRARPTLPDITAVESLLFKEIAGFFRISSGQSRTRLDHEMKPPLDRCSAVALLSLEQIQAFSTPFP